MATGDRTSLTTTGGPGRAPNRAMLRAVGFDDDDFDRPVVGVASLFSDITPCNAHLDRLARKGVRGRPRRRRRAADLRRPTASDGIMMGHRGMRYSLVSREVIADSHRGRRRGHEPRRRPGLRRVRQEHARLPDGHGPAQRPERVRLRRQHPARASGPKGRTWTSSPSSRRSGSTRPKSIDEKRLHKIECESCPGAGACGGMYTANTMSGAIEAMGMSLPYDASHPAVSAAKDREAFQAGRGAGRTSSRRTSARATSSPASRWRTRTRSCWPWAARPTPSCT